MRRAERIRRAAQPLLAAAILGLWAAAGIAQGAAAQERAAEQGRAVASQQDLLGALETARGGERLLLAPGDYGRLALDGRRMQMRFATPVTIASADPADPARFTGLGLRDIANLAFEGVIFDYTFAAGDTQRTRPFAAAQVQGLTIRDSVFSGDLARGLGEDADGYGIGIGLSIRDGSDILLEGNEFFDWHRGLLATSIRNLTVRGNDVHGIRSDGMNFVSVQKATIEDNVIHDFRASFASSDHRDMIQFWTAGTDRPSTDVTIRNNILNSGAGGFTQSIFMRNEVVDRGEAGTEMYYRDVTIEGNVIVNSHLHGITVGEAEGLTIRNNTLVHNARTDGDDGSPALWTPRINLSSRSQRVEVTGNIVSEVVVGRNDRATERPGWRIADNLEIQDRDPKGRGWYDDVFLAPRTGDPSSLASFAYRADGPAGKGALGAPRLRDMGGAAVIRATRDPRFVNRFTLDARLGAGSAAEDAAFLWRFEDGSTASGGVIDRVFPDPGEYRVRLELRSTDGPAQTAQAVLTVPDPAVLRLAPDRGIFELADRGEIALPEAARGGPAGALQLTGEALALPKEAIPGFFGARDIALRMRLRALRGDGDPTGEILRIHQALILEMDPAGSLTVRIFPEGREDPILLRTAPLRLHDGQWHEIVLRYAAGGEATLEIDGGPAARRPAAGPLPQMRSWGLSLGNPFGGKSLRGEIDALELRANAASFAAP